MVVVTRSLIGWFASASILSPAQESIILSTYEPWIVHENRGTSQTFAIPIPSTKMNLFASVALIGFCMLFQLLAVNGAVLSTSKSSTTTSKTSSTSAKSSTTTSKSSSVTSKSSSTVALSTTKISSTLSSTATYPTPTVPIGAEGGPFATVEGRMFQIQSKTQYFAGMTPV